MLSERIGRVTDGIEAEALNRETSWPEIWSGHHDPVRATVRESQQRKFGGKSQGRRSLMTRCAGEGQLPAPSVRAVVYAVIAVA